MVEILKYSAPKSVEVGSEESRRVASSPSSLL